MIKMILIIGITTLVIITQAQNLPGSNRNNRVINSPHNVIIKSDAITKIAPELKPYIAINEIRGTGTSTMAIRKVSGDYELADNDYLVIALPAYQGAPLNITISLPAAAANEGRIYVIKNSGDGFVHVGVPQLNEWGENAVRKAGTPIMRTADVYHNSSVSFQSDGKLWWRF